MSSPTLNERAQRQADFLAMNAANLRVAVQPSGVGAKIIDCGINVPGGLQAGLGMARVCLAGQAEVTMVPGEVAGVASPVIQVSTDNPILACMASQYAGRPIQLEKYFAMGSGPFRAAWGGEELFNDIPGQETPPVAVAVLETNKLPTDAVVNHIAENVKLPANKITLLAAPASSMAGNIQVVARSLETALHKLHELKFDLGQILSGFGSAPLPPVGKDDLNAIGRTNDAILYGGRVVLWVNGDDDAIIETGPKVPAGASPDYGEPFAAIFERYNQNFYEIDPLLFSPAEVVFHNLKSGKSHVFGRPKPDVLWKSFYGE